MTTSALIFMIICIVGYLSWFSFCISKVLKKKN